MPDFLIKRKIPGPTRNRTMVIQPPLTTFTDRPLLTHSNVEALILYSIVLDNIFILLLKHNAPVCMHDMGVLLCNRNYSTTHIYKVCISTCVKYGKYMTIYQVNGTHSEKFNIGCAVSKDIKMFRISSNTLPQNCKKNQQYKYQ
jgi:hypothetical protein